MAASFNFNLVCAWHFMNTLRGHPHNAAGLMWGGFEYPLSKFSAIYQLILGFFVLVIVSSYTANLASFITISARPTAAVSRLDDAVSSNGRIGICADASDSSTISMIGALYPRLHLTLGASFTDLSDRLRSRNLCDGAIMQTIAYKRLRTNATGINCNLRTMENIHAEFSGWATNRASSCINVALATASRYSRIKGSSTS